MPANSHTTVSQVVSKPPATTAGETEAKEPTAAAKPTPAAPSSASRTSTAHRAAAPAASAFVGVRVVSNSDVTTLAWQTSRPISGCLGFAVERQVGDETTSPEVLANHVGFKGTKPPAGVTALPSTQWPIQRFVWSDFDLKAGQRVRYRISPMLGTPDALTRGEPSPWSAWISVGTGQTPGCSAYFNRGMVGTQFVARQVPASDAHGELTKDIETPGNTLRNFLSGCLRPALLDLLAQAKTDGVEVYAALYELNDPELIAALTGLGARASLILGSGAFFSEPKDGKPAEPDENAQVRATLRTSSSIQLFDRLVTGNHFAHNKFVVFMDGAGKPQKVWTGSTNWTVTGLCTQVNNGLLLESPELAADFTEAWQRLKEAGSGYPPALSKAGDTPGTATLEACSVQAWHAPCSRFGDLAAATRLIQNAQQGVLFLMFNPGTGDGKQRPFSLEQVIHQLDDSKIFVHGVINQQSATAAGDGTTLQLTNKGTQLPSVDLSEIVPSALAEASNYFQKEFRYSPVMIHSKIVVLDPFGAHPVVMTGSHNMGPKASACNDDNLVILENCPGLAAEYAVNVMGVYTHYKWLYMEAMKAKPAAASGASKTAFPHFDGMDTDDSWQQRFSSGPDLREIEFWMAPQA